MKKIITILVVALALIVVGAAGAVTKGQAVTYYQADGSTAYGIVWKLRDADTADLIINGSTRVMKAQRCAPFVTAPCWLEVFP